MRGTLSILITVLICVVVLALYFFIGRSQLNKQIREVESQQQALELRLQKINQMRAELPDLMEQMPHWKERLAFYKQAIPEPIEDDVFLSLLAKQLRAQDVQLLSVDVTPRGAWLGEINEALEGELRAKGIDPEQARSVNAAFYSINILGGFDNVLAAFENMKQYGRLYTIDEVTGPAGGAPGAVTQIVDPDVLSIQVSGRIYYGIPDDYLTNVDLVKVFESSVLKPGAQRIQAEISARGQELLNNPDLPAPEQNETSTENSDAAPSDGDSGADDDPAGDIASAGLTVGCAHEEG